MKFAQSPNINALWGQLVIEELVRNGCQHFCLSPGSRSAPLVSAVALHPKAKNMIHFDERGTSFYALGVASVINQPVAVLSTSGTAVANFLPAVIEASKKKLPLILLTADRPPELRKTGADQTIDQVGIFSDYIRWQFDLPCPTEAIAPEVVLTTIDQAVYRAFGSPSGPVHVNCMFREPLAPLKEKKRFLFYLQNLKSWAKTGEPFTKYTKSRLTLPKGEAQKITKMINKIKNGVIVVGKLKDATEARYALKLSKKLKWPIFPDVTSGLRLGCADSNVIHHYDQILTRKEFLQKFDFDGVLHFGGRITAKRWYQYLQQKKPSIYVMVNHHPLRNDPLHNVTLRVESSVSEFVQKIFTNVNAGQSTAYLKRLQKMSDFLDLQIEEFQNRNGLLDEPKVARLVSKLLPKQSGLFLSNSMPVRDMDMYATHQGNSPAIGGNRGASGIDGTIASAIGFCRALDRPTTLLIGDLAFLHDVNSLAMVGNLKKPLIVIILNNQGGGIFSFLPIAKFPEIFERYFAASHHWEFHATANLFGVDYQRPLSENEFVSVYQKAFKSSKSTLIEIMIDRPGNHHIHKTLQNRLSRSLSSLF